MTRQIYTELPLEAHAAEPVAADRYHVEESVFSRPWRWYLEGVMLKRILGVLAVILVGYLLYLGYQRYVVGRQQDSGVIHSDDPVVVRNETDDAPAPKPRVVTTPAPVAAAVAAPATDSIAPNPTNGTTYAGTGKFQVYRQGNLTWRVDTDSGASCILFATMEEWRKPIVYSHGCNQN